MRAIVYLRQSQDRTGEELGVTRQREDAVKLAELRNMTIVGELADNDTSAAGKRKRPGFDALLTALDAGEADAVISWDMSRVTRNRRDTLRLLEIGERRGVHLAFVRGSDLDLSTPAGRLSADILAGVARHEIDQKSDRQRRALVQAAEAGKRTGGRRPFGYLADGVTIHPGEAEALRKAYTALLTGVSLGQIARDVNAAGWFTPQTKRDGSPSTWTSQTVGLMLRNPRYAGLRGVGRRRDGHGRPLWEIVGSAEWPRIVTEETWRAADAILSSPGRRHGPHGGRGLLTGVAECGVCADGTTVHAGAAPRGGNRVYRCAGSLGHFSRQRDPIDEYVSAVVVERLGRADARDLLYVDDRPDVAGLRDELATLQARLTELTELHIDGTITTAQLRAGTERARLRVREVEAQLADAGRVNVLGPLIDGRDVAGTWAALDTDRQRAVIETLIRVVIHPIGRGRRTFDPTTVDIAWRSE